MAASLARLEQSLFRALNAVVEPAVRKGFGSLTLAPASLIVLETVGFKSGQQRRTPLWSIGVGPYRLVSTARGDRSFWVKNLQKNGAIRFYLGGCERRATAVVIRDGKMSQDVSTLPAPLRKIAGTLAEHALVGWAFALLVPDRA